VPGKGANLNRALRGGAGDCRPEARLPSSGGDDAAIERYRRTHNGQPPAGLAALVPASCRSRRSIRGRPFVYKASRVDYLLYSLAINRKDDGGEIYGIGSLNPMPAPRLRDFGIRVPLSARRGGQ
jgi:hypothetical protein